MWHLSGRVEVHTRFWRENLRTSDHLKIIDEDARIILKHIFKK
jgi:hypothetical protein